MLVDDIHGPSQENIIGVPSAIQVLCWPRASPLSITRHEEVYHGDLGMWLGRVWAAYLCRDLRPLVWGMVEEPERGVVATAVGCLLM